VNEIVPITILSIEYSAEIYGPMGFLRKVCIIHAKERIARQILRKFFQFLGINNRVETMKISRRKQNYSFSSNDAVYDSKIETRLDDDDWKDKHLVFLRHFILFLFLEKNS